MLPAIDWLALFGHFLLLSLLAVGGAVTVAPDIHRVMVDQMGLLSDAQFSASIAIGQASPGPNVLFVAVMGYQAAGLPGACSG
jgi:chromate transporter